MIEAVAIENSEKIPPPCWGVSLPFLTSFIDSCGRAKIEQYTTSQICIEYVLPLTKPTQCSYCDLLLRNEEALSHDKQSTSRPCVGPATIFLSHSWQSCFLHVVDPLLRRYSVNIGSNNSSGSSSGGGDGAQEVYVWFDLFSNNQHSTLSHPFEWWCSTFKDAVAAIGHTSISLAPWNNPVALTRAWCCYELFCSIETKSKVEILMTDADVHSFQRALITDFESVNAMIARVDIRLAQATRPDDKTSIYGAVEASPGGFDGVNTIIFEHLTNWLCDSALIVVEYIQRKDVTKTNSALDRLLSSYDEGETQQHPIDPTVDSVMHGGIIIATNPTDPTSLANSADSNPLLCTIGEGGVEYTLHYPVYVQFMCNAGRLLKDSGRLQEGCDVLKSAVGIAVLHFGERHQLTLYSQSYLGEALLEKGSTQEADTMLSNVFILQSELLGDNHEDTITTAANLGTTRLRQNRISDAEELISTALITARSLYGDVHRVTQKINSALGSVYSQKGDYSAAMCIYEEVLQYRIQVLGQSHPEAMSTANDLAHSIWKAGNRDIALDMFINLLQMKKAKRGASHPSTLFTMSNLSALYRDIGKLDEAEAMMRETLRLRKLVLGDTHPSLLITMSNLSGVFKDLKRFDEAADLLQYALKISMERYGPTHNHTLTYQNNLALVIAELGHIEEAESMIRTVLGIRRQQDSESGGTDRSKACVTHINTLCVIYRLGVFLSEHCIHNGNAQVDNSNKKAEAIALLKECADKRAVLLGAHHVDTVTAQKTLNKLLDNDKSTTTTITSTVI